MANYVKPQPNYDLPPRRISGNRAEKLDQIDAAIQELLDIKLLECAAENPNVRFIAARRGTHWAGMTITLLVLLLLLVLILAVRPVHAQGAPADGGRWQAAGVMPCPTCS